MTFLASFLVFLLFLGPVVLAILGWPVEGEFVKRIQPYPSFFILAVYIGYVVMNGKVNIKDVWPSLGVLLAVIGYIFICSIVGKSANRMVCYNSMMLPAMYYFFFSTLKGKNQIRCFVRVTILTMFSINCLLSFYERITMVLIFPIDYLYSDINFIDIDERSFFRSSALIGHPLSNALIMSTIMIFVLTSRMSLRKKYVLYFLGLVSLFCFNARGAIIFSVIALGLYLFHSFFYKQRQNPFLSSVLFALFSIVFLYILYSSGLAGRFVERGPMISDSSTLARIDIWMFFYKYDLFDFLWGVSMNDAQMIAYNLLGVRYLENWLIMSILLVGLILTVLVVVLFFFAFKKALYSYDRFRSFLLVFTCIGIASTNNSLACGVPAIAMFFSCCYAFFEIPSSNKGLLLFQNICKKHNSINKNLN